jgi:hypothetical protein
MCATAACSQRLTPRSSGAACEEDRVLVTANVGDYLKLARARDVHPGIVSSRSASSRAEQRRLLRAAAAAIIPLGDLLNKVVWVTTDGSIRVEDIPPP